MQGGYVFGLAGKRYMEMRRQYQGLDVVKFLLALLVAQRHIVQIYFGADSRWRILLNNWLSNLAVPVFFIAAGFLLFGKCSDLDDREKDRKTVFRYCARILKMYVLWSILYLPVDWYNWYHGERLIGKGLLSWFHSFLVCSTIPQLWYLPALALACFLVWWALDRGVKPQKILLAGSVFLLIGYFSDNWYFNQRFPEGVQKLLAGYRNWFVTPRNGVFYGIFYVALGLWAARSSKKIPVWCSGIGFFFFLFCMYREVITISDAGSNTNFVLFAAPAAYCLFCAATGLCLKDRKMYKRLRGMSQWIYLAHFYFFYFLSWLRPWNPIPFNSKSVTVMIMVPLILFSWGMVRLSETEKGRWLGKLI